MTSRTIKVDLLARVEGEGAFKVVLRDGAVRSAELSIFEPPRFFEALLRGRGFEEAHDLTSRICGICPVAYQMSAVHAMERALGLRVEGPLRDLRRLLYCGEWIGSHALHVHLLHAPDFLGLDGPVEMARAHPEAFRRGLALKAAGNRIVALLGGREVHPVNVRVGGFHRAPKRRELAELADDLKRARDDALESVRWTAGFAAPELERDFLFVALRHPGEYPMNEGRIASSGGLDIEAGAFHERFRESQTARSTALHSRTAEGEAYLVGPLARYALNAARLRPVAREAAREAGLGEVCRNPFRAIVVRAVETLHAVDEALRIVEDYREPEVSALPLPPLDPLAGPVVGAAATEAPRGLLHHRYEVGGDGLIRAATIVPPTSQNQASIEADLVQVVEAAPDLATEALRRRCEQAIRNHDPCISCATHFLRLDVVREGSDG
ncbi:nickel-dependent hydrogenase large subunit [Albimonas sp. CAU 1670]|uniref:Ni/Fe hydrogenase subunit alpha n=1 Tax=Albimonas sp. CAU 1670 TaxID=3032599 RepID=UPI0023DB630F|nr:nickel-dependent hydrogenase large subunit [Albimonas sp. CAU 1670]MDF2231829.1 nickel-dependent hydrogenase large subunit [Albimonas sp. CAU 1670]